MAFGFADRVKESTTTTGTGTYSLAGAYAGMQTFVAGIGSGNTVDYCVTNDTDWEVGTGTITSGSPDTLARTTILASSNSGAAVNWGAGTKRVFCVISADKAALFAMINAAQSWSAQQYYAESTLTDGASIAWNLETQPEAKVTLAGNRTMAAPSNMQKGWHALTVIQDATGSRTLAYNAVFHFGDTGAPTLSTAASSKDLLMFKCDGTYMVYAGMMPGIQA